MLLALLFTLYINCRVQGLNQFFFFRYPSVTVTGVSGHANVFAKIRLVS